MPRKERDKGRTSINRGHEVVVVVVVLFFHQPYGSKRSSLFNDRGFLVGGEGEEYWMSIVDSAQETRR